MCVPSGVFRSGCECGCCDVHRVVTDTVHHYELGFRPPARKGHPVQAFKHGGHTEAGSFTLHILHNFDVLLCGRIPYRRRILHDGSNKHLVV